MRTGPEGIRLIKHYEACVLKAYPDPKTGGAPWTVGWGATGHGIGPGVVWTQMEADQRLQDDVAVREVLVETAVKVPVNQGQFDALVSIVFNVGAGSPTRDGIIRLKDGRPSSLLRRLNAGDYPGARGQFAQWISPGSNVERGLRRRRAAEQALWDGLDAEQAIAIGDTAA